MVCHDQILLTYTFLHCLATFMQNGDDDSPSISPAGLGLGYERSLKCLNILSLTKKVQMKIVCACNALQIALFLRLKAKMNVSVPSDVNGNPVTKSRLSSIKLRRLCFDIREGVTKYRYQVGFNEVP